MAEEAEGHGDGDGFFDVDVEALDVVLAEHGQEGVVVGVELGGCSLAGPSLRKEGLMFDTYGCIVAAQSFECPSCSAAEHHHDFDAAGLELLDFGPEVVVHGVVGVVFVEGDVAGLLVEVDG